MIVRMTPVATAVFAALYPAAQGLAQERGEPGAVATRLEPVVVTAARRSENLQDVAQSVTALSTEFIQKQALTSTYDLIGALPSTSVTSYVPGQNNIVMRGIATGSSEFRVDSQVSVYLDEQPMTAISQQADVRLIDIERVESLPGPQGTLFGSSAQAGTIHYVTNKPDISGYSSEVAAEIGTTKGGDPSYDVSSWVNLPISDNFALRVVGFWSEEGGYVDNVLGETLVSENVPGADLDTNADIAEDKQNVYRNVGGRVSGLWTINEKWDLLATGIYQRGDLMGTWETDPFLGENKITRFYDEWRDDWWYSTSATLKGDLGFAELSVNGSYFNRKVNYEFDNTNYAHSRSYFYDGTIYDTDALRATLFNWQKQNRWSTEVRLTSQGDSKLKWMVGAFYEDVYDWWENGVEQPGGLTSTPAWDVANEQCFDAIDDVPGLVCPLPPSDIYYYKKYHNEVKQLAFFGEMTYNLTDKWSVTGGGRWFEFDRNQFDMYQVPKGLPSDSDPEANGLISQGTDSDTTFKFATNYHVTPDVMLYFLYSEGFRLGGNNSPRAADTGEVPLTYGPDSLANYEAGLKSEWLDHRLQLNVSAFYMQWDDIQVHFSDTDRANGGAYWIEGNINGGEAEQKGVEFNGTWYATDRLNFSWSAFFASPEFTEDTFALNADPTVDDPYIAKGWTMPVSPKEKYWASVEYTFPDFLPWAGDFWTRFSYTYQGQVWNSLGRIEDFENAETPEDREAALEFYLPEWKSGTFQIGFTSESGWDAALVLRNVFDDASYSYLSGSWYGEDFTGVNADGDPRWRHVRTLQRPRNISLSFSKKW